MIFTSILAAITISTNSITFTASASGVRKGECVEFGFITKESDHAYEALFVLDDSIEDIENAIKKAGIPSGRPIDFSKCDLRSVGPIVELKPAITDFITFKEGIKYQLPSIVHTGGARDEKGELLAKKATPQAFFSFFDCPQSPLVFDALFNQGDVYGNYLAKNDIQKGKQHTFALTWKGESMKSLEYEFNKTNVAEVLIKIKEQSKNNILDVKLSFSPELSVFEATQLASAIHMIDSDRIKINGVKDGNIYYRAFQPLIKWLDRSERLLQPFELFLGEKDKLLYIDEDWSTDSLDPKLSEKEISFSDSSKYTKTKTCFIYVNNSEKLSRIFEAMSKFKKGQVTNWYIFGRN